MSQLQLTVDSGDAFSVRRFSAEESASALFSVGVWARASSPEIDLEAIVGKAASLRVVHGATFIQNMGARLWKGVCAYAEQVQAEPTGLSTYYLRIVPRLYLLTQRRNYRIFQHLNIPDIVDAILGEWNVDHVWKATRGNYPKLEFKVQYGESDYTFVSRLLEEAGIAFVFADPGASGTLLTLDDAMPSRDARPTLPYVDNPHPASEKEVVTRVRLSHEVRPGAPHAPRLRLPEPRLPPLRLRADGPRPRRFLRAVPVQARRLPRGEGRRRHAGGRRSGVLPLRAGVRHGQGDALPRRRTRRQAHGRVRHERLRPLPGRAPHRQPPPARGDQRGSAPARAGDEHRGLARRRVVRVGAHRVRLGALPADAEDPQARRRRRPDRHRGRPRRAGDPHRRVRARTRPVPVGPAGHVRRALVVLDPRLARLGRHRLRHARPAPHRAGGAHRLPAGGPGPARGGGARLQRDPAGAVQAAGPQDAEHLEERLLDGPRRLQRDHVRGSQGPGARLHPGPEGSAQAGQARRDHHGRQQPAEVGPHERAGDRGPEPHPTRSPASTGPRSPAPIG